MQSILSLHTPTWNTEDANRMQIIMRIHVFMYIRKCIGIRFDAHKMHDDHTALMQTQMNKRLCVCAYSTNCNARKVTAMANNCDQINTNKRRQKMSSRLQIG